MPDFNIKFNRMEFYCSECETKFETNQYNIHSTSRYTIWCTTICPSCKKEVKACAKILNW